MLERISPEGLVFLKEQALVLIYNQEVELHNAAAREQQKRKTLSGERKKSPESKQRGVSIEQLEKPGYFNIRIDNAKLFMDRHEIKAIYKIASEAESPAQGAARLYRWFQKERSDVLTEGAIESEKSPLLPLIYQELLDTFTSS